LYVSSSALDYGDISNYINAPSVAPRIAPVKRLNPSGNDVLKRNSNIAVAGDIQLDLDSGIPYSSIIDVAIGDAETYTILDSNKNRYFTYSKFGEMLYAFGNYGNQDGTTTLPVSITYKGTDFLVLDSATGKLTIYKQTNYGALLIQALSLYNDYKYEESVEVWQKTLQNNANLDIAYVNIGKAMYRQERYKEAMNYFYLAEDAENYSKAFREYRNSFVSRNIFIFLLLVIALLVLIVKTFSRISAINRKDKYRDKRGRLSCQLL